MLEQVKQMAVDSGKLPKDLILGEALLYLTGSTEAVIENYRSILVFTDELLKIQTKTMRIEILGRSLGIEYYNQDQMKIIGQIQEIKFCR